MKRTHMCGDLRANHIDQKVTLTGWVHRRRDHGGVIFIDLRDRGGIAQVVINPEKFGSPDRQQSAALRSEYVLEVEGRVRLRPKGMANPKLATGEVELEVTRFEVLNPSLELPFQIAEDSFDVSETLRLKHRHLDLRRPALARNFILRHRLAQQVRHHLDERGFLEIETPFLTKSTPEGARDYLVPARLDGGGAFYALPQSPQLFKQLLMISGFDRYFQIVKCFRDEDLRANRQPEFTQIDLEMSFVDAEDVIAVTEGLMNILGEMAGRKVNPPFPRLTYEEAISRFGTDKPDTRFALELRDVSGIMKHSSCKIFSDAAARGDVVMALPLPGAAEKCSRRQIEEYEEVAKRYGAKGLAWIKIEGREWVSPIAKFFQEEERRKIENELGVKSGDLVFFVADERLVAAESLGFVRLKIGDDWGLRKSENWNLLWIVDFPLFEFSKEENRLVARHHPFTSPNLEDIPLLKSDPKKVRANAYDIILNGEEMGGGSLRIHHRPLQQEIFNILKFSHEEAERRFGFLLRALEMGAPPHGGIALGLDRLMMFICGTDSIRDVIPFPKTQRGTCLLTEAPSPVDPIQLKELGIALVKSQTKPE